MGSGTIEDAGAQRLPDPDIARLNAAADAISRFVPRAAWPAEPKAAPHHAPLRPPRPSAEDLAFGSLDLPQSRAATTPVLDRNAPATVLGTLYPSFMKPDAKFDRGSIVQSIMRAYLSSFKRAPLVWEMETQLRNVISMRLGRAELKYLIASHAGDRSRMRGLGVLEYVAKVGAYSGRKLSRGHVKPPGFADAEYRLAALFLDLITQAMRTGELRAAGPA